jgi:putative membrane protein
VADPAHTSEIEQGKLAQRKAKAPAVRKFADMMVKNHTQAKQQQSKLFKKLNLVPTQSKQATLLEQDTDRMLGSLRDADGAAFDVAYMESQIEAHQKVLDAIDEQLLPAASDQALIQELKTMRDTVASHLTEAKTVHAQVHTSGMTNTTTDAR